MRDHRHSRTQSSRHLVRRLAAYFAGSAALAAAESSAAIVFTNLEASPIVIVDDIFNLDLNHDGEIDFALIQEYRHDRWTDSSGHGASATTNKTLIRGLLQNRVLANPLKLPAGALIDPMATNVLEQGILASLTRVCSYSGCDRFSYGSFIPFTYTSDASSGYLGLQFSLPSGGRHSGWVEVDASYETLALLGFAYETAPGIPIHAGDKGNATNVPGDTNADGKVDLEDLNNVRNNFGGTGLGDANGDGVVDLEDLNAVRNNFGAGEANAVPEPPSLLLLAAGAAGLALWRSTRSRCQQN